MNENKIILTLRSARERVLLTQKETVEILKERFDYPLTRQKLASYETDSTGIPIDLADYLADIYFLTRDDIFFGKESTFSYTYQMKRKQEA
ncbi:XRE family transcriptional regulator [Enterococcus sp. AZ102]|uniref:XRE family transcriptional regulator n=1 Tax=Enterococcus sp. AZ102 TaxID=2774865 RepID=UPI003F213222